MKCRICQEWIVSEFHKCPPAYLVWAANDEEESEATTVHAYNAQGAAEAFVEQCQSEYSTYEGVTENVKVVLASDPSVVHTFSIGLEAIPSYYVISHAKETRNGTEDV